jgi:hypothetical protein
MWSGIQLRIDFLIQSQSLPSESWYIYCILRLDQQVKTGSWTETVVHFALFLKPSMIWYPRCHIKWSPTFLRMKTTGYLDCCIQQYPQVQCIRRLIDGWPKFLGTWPHPSWELKGPGAGGMDVAPLFYVIGSYKCRTNTCFSLYMWKASQVCGVCGIPSCCIS